MQVIKYRIGQGAKMRLANGIIDYDKVYLNTIGTDVCIKFNTIVPHRLIEGEKVILTKGTSVYEVTPEITSPKTFVVYVPLLENVTIDQCVYRNESEDVLLHFSEPINVKSDYSEEFSIYDDSGKVIVEHCSFFQKPDGSYIKDYAFIPAKYNTGLSFAETYPLAYVANTLLFDWENLTKENVYDFNIYFENAYIDFKIPFQRDYDANVDMEKVRSDMLDEEAKKMCIPKSIDMEKQMFEPYIKSGNTYIAVDKIEFKMHFRDRYDSSGNITSGWTTDDSKFWNDDASTDYSDNLIDLGFLMTDVRYEKKKLKKSFIRLSFYDSDDITNQSLLAYSTIFFDAKGMYTTYLHNKVYGTNERIDSQINVQSRYNYDDSSDGFYIHLYPTVLDENNVGTIYMKVEFNHAKYGKIIPFITPQDSNGDPIPFSSSSFPKGYIEETSDGYGVNMQKYLKDTLMEVKVAYNADLGKYIYYFPWAKDNDNKKITITLFEPRVNGISN